MLSPCDELLPPIPPEPLAQIERTAAQVERIGQAQIEHHPEWVVQRLQQQALAVGKLRYALTALQQQLAQQQATQQQLEAQLEQAQRAGKRQAAPFRVAEAKRTAKRKPPGRKSGHPGAWRQSPPAHPSDEHIEVPLPRCPQCGETLAVGQQRAVEQTIVEIPPVRPRVIRLRTYRNHCEHCQQAVRSQHPLQVSTAVGAAGTHLGPRAVGVASYLNKQLGLPMRKTCAVLQQLAGLSLSPGGLSQALKRAADRLEPRYDALLDILRQSPTLYCDETGWWVAAVGAWLWVLTNDQGTYYRILPSRNRETAKTLIGETFEGVLVSDCLAIYDDLNPRQHKCYAHHLKAISQALQTPSGKHSRYLLQLRALLHTALLLKRLQPQLQPALIAHIRQYLESRADTLLRQPRGDPQTEDAQVQQEEKLRRRLQKQQDHLFTFLDYPTVAATNNAAERQLRPAVICRKLSCGNKTQSGAHTWEILTSLAATAQQQGVSFIDWVAEAMTLPPLSPDDSR
ncbi:IS66 family transposase [Vacuolonema iberomarrocanum]|uniref:IS66 family transposase n=1 Tax=Vacuolonema iberomarrocanum TaxID=3454632 RepID=UPI0019E94DBF|nr:IS66 family transposase [filamentous cyanobacterium LEGE 07170]